MKLSDESRSVVVMVTGPHEKTSRSLYEPRIQSGSFTWPEQMSQGNSR